MALTQVTICKKIFTIGAIGPELQSPTYGVQRVGDSDAAWPRLCRRVIGHVTVTAKISCVAKAGRAAREHGIGLFFTADEFMTAMALR